MMKSCISASLLLATGIFMALPQPSAAEESVQLINSWTEYRDQGEGVVELRGETYLIVGTDEEYTVYFDEAGNEVGSKWLNADEPVRVPGTTPQVDAAEKDDERLRQLGGVKAVRSIVLDPLPEKEMPRDVQVEGGPKSGQQVGTHRDLPKTFLQWEQLPDGSHVYALEISSPDAQALRLVLRDIALPQGSSFAIFDPAKPEEGFGELRPFNPEEYFTPTIFSDTVLLTCLVPAGEDPAQAQFRLAEVVHFYDLPEDEAKSEKQAGACNIDVTCHPAWHNVSRAVGLVTYSSGGKPYACTGTLLNDMDPKSAIPYFMTAYHCIGTQAEANTAEVFWNYQTSTCNGAPPSLASRPRTIGGADFLAGGSRANSTDFAFMRLRRTLPSGLFLAGWTNQTATGSVTSIHHPQASYKRISFGSIVSSTTNYYIVKWNLGTTETGSSGSPLFNDNQDFVGQLWGGAASCSNLEGLDEYGRFSRTYSSVSTWLTAPNPCTYTLLETSRTIAPTQSTFTFNFEATPGCFWTVTSNESWLTVLSPPEGAGSSTITAQAAANTGFSSRVGVLTFTTPDGQSRAQTVTQEGLLSGLDNLSSTWFLAEGATVPGFDTFVLIANPHDQAANVRVTFLAQNSPGQLLEMQVAPRSRATIKVNDVVPNDAVSTIVQETGGRGIAVERAMYSVGPDGRWYGGHSSTGIPAAGNEWFLAEGATVAAGPGGGNFETYILVQNPNNNQVNITATFFPQGEAAFDRSFTIEANRRFTIAAGASLDERLRDRAFSTRIRGQNILVERAMWWNAEGWTGQGFMEGNASPAIRELSTQWYLAEGNTIDFDDFILLVNPNNVAVEATIQYLREANSLVSRTLTIGANERQTINVRWDPAGMGSASRHGTMITSSGPLAVERSMYRTAGGLTWVAGHNSTASPILSTSWLLPEGATVPIAFGNLTTEILLANPQEVSANVTVAFLMADGQTVTITRTIPARQRITIVTNDIAQLAAQAFSTVILSNTPIVAERSSYWGTDTPFVIEPAGATNSMGIPLLSAAASSQLLKGEDGQDWTLYEFAPAQSPTPTPTVTPTPLAKAGGALE